MGSEVFLHFALDAPGVKADELRELVGDEAVEAPRRRPTTTAAPSSRRSTGHDRARGRAGDADADTHRLHFFSLETGEAI